MRPRGAAVRGLLWAAVLLVGTVRVAWAQAPPEAIEYYARDAVGSVRIVFDAQGNVLGRSDYLPFGEAWNQSGALPRQRFTGQARDGEAGLDDFNARAYQPLFGRFTRPDPVSGSLFAPQSWNAYAYVQNRPLVATDPSGMMEEYVLEVTVVGTDPGKKKRPAPTNLNPDMAGWVMLRESAYAFDYLGGGDNFGDGGSTGYANFGSAVSDGEPPQQTPKTTPPLVPCHQQQPPANAPRIGAAPVGPGDADVPSADSLLAVRKLPSLSNLWNGTWFGGGTLNGVRGIGGEVTAGLFWDKQGFGYFWSAGPSAGHNQSIGGTFGAVDGGYDVFNGLMYEGSASASSLLGGTALFKGDQIHGFAYNPALGPPGASISAPVTTPVYLWRK